MKEGGERRAMMKRGGVARTLDGGRSPILRIVWVGGGTVSSEK